MRLGIVLKTYGNFKVLSFSVIFIDYFEGIGVLVLKIDVLKLFFP